MNLENTASHERSQSQKDKCCDFIYMKCLEQAYPETESRLIAARG